MGHSANEFPTNRASASRSRHLGAVGSGDHRVLWIRLATARDASPAKLAALRHRRPLVDVTPPPPPAELNFAAHLMAANAHRADKTAYVDDVSALTYGELAHRVQCCASALSNMGLRREERVLLLAHDTVDWPVAFLGALYAGIVPVAVNTLLTPDEYAFMLSHSRARAAIDRPRSSATPYSVTTWSTVFFIVVTGAPSHSRVTMREIDSSFVAECTTTNPIPSSEYIAPRAKSAWPPLPE